MYITTSSESVPDEISLAACGGILLWAGLGTILMYPTSCSKEGPPKYSLLLASLGGDRGGRGRLEEGSRNRCVLSFVVLCCWSPECDRGL